MSAATAMIASIVISILLDNLGSWQTARPKNTEELIGTGRPFLQTRVGFP